jgi:hypothetical protein
MNHIQWNCNMMRQEGKNTGTVNYLVLKIWKVSYKTEAFSSTFFFNKHGETLL